VVRALKGCVRLLRCAGRRRRRHRLQPATGLEVSRSGANRSATLHLDVLQLSGWLGGDVKASRNDNATRDHQVAADRTRRHPLCRPVVSSLLSCAAPMLKSCSRNAVSMSITQWSGAGCNITALSWGSECDSILSRPTTRRNLHPREGSLVLLVSGHRYRGVPPSISCCQRSVTPICQTPVS